MIVCIPTIFCSPLLGPLLRHLADRHPQDRVLLFVNREQDSADPIVTGRNVEVRWRPGATIYEEWNEALAEGERTGENVALLNDDVVLHPAALFRADLALKAHPEYGLMGLEYREDLIAPPATVRNVIGTFRTGGFGGFAFLVAPTSARVSAGFRWWYGDDDLANCIRISHGRKLGVCMDAEVRHPIPSTTGNQFAWTSEAAAEDAALYRRLWPTAP